MISVTAEEIASALGAELSGPGDRPPWSPP